MPDINGRSHVKDVTITIGLVSLRGSLYTVQRTNAGKDEETHLYCPACKIPGQSLGERYYCKDNPDHGPFTKAETRSGKEENGAVILLEREAVETARVSLLPAGILDLAVHDRAEVMAATFAKGNTYAFMPAPGAENIYGVFIAAIEARPDLCLLAKTNLRKRDNFVMLDCEGGQLVIRDLLWPEDVKELQAPAYTVNEKHVTDAIRLLEASMEPFDKAEYSKESRARLAAVIEDATMVEKPKGKAKLKVVSDTNLEEVLKAALSAQAKKKTARKKAS